jgi:hypothetical protein
MIVDAGPEVKSKAISRLIKKSRALTWEGLREKPSPGIAKV